MAVTWITPAGNLGTLPERITVSIPLQATSDNLINYRIIAGSLPKGLRLDGNFIKGGPNEVSKFTTSKFVVRADDGENKIDRTFSLSVDGADVPQWLTEQGFLQVGQGQAYFVLDNSFVDFQLEATDSDRTAGDILEYYLQPNSGELPPGLIITKDGRITGYTDPIFSVEYGNATSGNYDTGSYDVVPLDKMEARSNGFDDFLYDAFEFDYSENTQVPRRISRAYNFVITVTDGINESQRFFRMWVVTEEFLQADNSIVQVDTNLFTADSSSTRFPLWITDAYLGRYRANNYITIFLDVYSAPGLPTSLIYFLNPTNPDGSTSTLPPGMFLDQSTGDIAGNVPYQDAVTKPYSFTVEAVVFLLDVTRINYNLRGTWNSSTTYAVNDAVSYDGIIYVCVEEHRNRLPTESPDFWLSSVSSSKKTFTIDIIGEIESAIEWVTESNLGTIEPGKPSTIQIQARSFLYGNTVSYIVTEGNIPPGLELISTGSIQGKVKQFGDENGPGITRFYDDTLQGKTFDTTFDSENTTFDRVFTFNVQARDSARFAVSNRSFSLRVISPSNKSFANIYVKAFQKKEKRLEWFNFITDANIFRNEDIFRYGDTNFGIQTELKMILFAGIESKDATTFVQAMSRNHYRKQLKFGDLRIAKAKDPETQEVIYEVVYINIVDNFEKNGKSAQSTIELPDKINSPVIVSYDAIKVDSDVPLVSDRDHQRIFPNSIKNMRRRIQNIGERDRTYLPLWMRSLQDDAFFESGYVSALPLCYANPGKGEQILSRIKLSNFDFKLINFEVDRYLIDILDSVIENKYLAFPQIGEKLP
jgi:hypothetical protein